MDIEKIEELINSGDSSKLVNFLFENDNLKFSTKELIYLDNLIDTKLLEITEKQRKFIKAQLDNYMSSTVGSDSESSSSPIKNINIVNDKGELIEEISDQNFRNQIDTKTIIKLKNTSPSKHINENTSEQQKALTEEVSTLLKVDTNTDINHIYSLMSKCIKIDLYEEASKLEQYLYDNDMIDI